MQNWPPNVVTKVSSLNLEQLEELLHSGIFGFAAAAIALVLLIFPQATAFSLLSFLTFWLTLFVQSKLGVSALGTECWFILVVLFGATNFIAASLVANTVNNFKLAATEVLRRGLVVSFNRLISWVGLLVSSGIYSLELSLFYGIRVFWVLATSLTIVVPAIVLALHDGFWYYVGAVFRNRPSLENLFDLSHIKFITSDIDNVPSISSSATNDSSSDGGD